MISKIPVGLCRLTIPQYPDIAPFDPSTHYPEIDNPIIDGACRNEVYDAVRRIFAILGLDKERYGTREWNPLRTLVPAGGTCVIKPNLVSEQRKIGSDTRCIVTHASVVRPIIDYALKAVGDKGKVTVADAPQFDSDFEKIVNMNGLAKMLEVMKERDGRCIKLLDLRYERAIVEDEIVVHRIKLDGDPLGYSIVNLGEYSHLKTIDEHSQRFRGSDYDRSETVSHQVGGNHEYSISNTILSADCIISVPKLKTHRKAGVTLNLKNFVGINGKKNYIPHYRVGPISRGGDEMAHSTTRAMLLTLLYGYAERDLPLLGELGTRSMRLLNRIDRRIAGEQGRPARAGDWSGNDTIWRCILDLYFIALFADRTGSLRNVPSRRLFSIVDGIVAGEGNGPLQPNPRPEGLVIGGESLVCVDLTAIAAAGLDFNSFPTYANLREPLIDRKLEELVDAVEVNGPGDDMLSISQVRSSVRRPFELPDGWKLLST